MNSKPDTPNTENPEWTAERTKSAVRFNALPKSLQTKLSGRGPQKAPTKERITIRLSPTVLDSFKSGEPGWQGRIDDALKDWLRTHHR